MPDDGPDDDQGNDPAGTTFDASQDGLRSRINPDDLTVDWEAEGMDEAGRDEEEDDLPYWGGPPPDNFVWAHPSWSKGVFLLDNRKTGGRDAEYVLSKPVARHLMKKEDELVKAATVYPLMTRDGDLIFWPLRLGNAAEVAMRNPSRHVTTGKEAIVKARLAPHKITWRGGEKGKGGGGWRARPASVVLPAPVWPEDLEGLFMRTIKDRYISDLNDKTIRRFTGKE
jgi:hypothetical protein